MSYFTKLAYFLLSWPIWFKAYRRWAINLNMLRTSILLRPIRRDKEHTLIYGFMEEIVLKFVPFSADRAVLGFCSTINRFAF